MLARAFDVLDRRVLALLVFRDALGAPVTSPVAVHGTGVRSFVKRPGAIVLSEAPGLADYTAGFDPTPVAPAVGSVPVQLDIVPADPALARRRVRLDLPRDADPARSGQPDSVFQPAEIALLPTPLAGLAGLAAGLSVQVRRASDNRRIEGALVRLRPDGGRPEARAMTDAAGDALLLVPGVPLASPGAGAVVRPDLGAMLDVVVDPALARFHPDDAVDAARDAAARRVRDLIDPDDLAARLGAAAAATATPTRIEAGRVRTAAIGWSP